MLYRVSTKFIIQKIHCPKKNKNTNILFYLSLACLHQECIAESIRYLQKAVNGAPKVDFFANQLQILEQLMPSDLSREQLSQRHNKKILVVEDSATTRRFIIKTLKDFGYSTVEARNGLEALSKLHSEEPDLVLLDIILPKMDGYKVLSIIKSGGEKYESLPVIMLTSKDGMVSKLKGKMAGSDAYLTKPFKNDVLLKTIDNFI